MKKKAIALMVMVGLAVLMLPAAALAGTTQEVTGNPAAAEAITAPSANTGISFSIGDNADADSDTDNAVYCQSNVVYDVKINCDVTGNKTTANMWEWTGSAYVALGKYLSSAMAMKEHAGGTYADITGTATAISGFTSMTATGGTTTYVDYKQPVGYGDLVLASNSYRHLLTYTILAHV